MLLLEMRVLAKIEKEKKPKYFFKCLVLKYCQLGGLMSESWTEDWVAWVTFKKERLKRKRKNWKI